MQAMASMSSLPTFHSRPSVNAVCVASQCQVVRTLSSQALNPVQSASRQSVCMALIRDDASSVPVDSITSTSTDVSAKTTFIAETLLPTRTGKYRLRGYKHTVDGGATYTEPTAIIYGKPEGQSKVPVRVHDACFTSEVLGSMKCDCAEQLQLAMDYIRENAPGIVIYLQQEGRGIGLANKIAAYSLQEKGYDTVDANRALGLPDDAREYTSVFNILSNLDVKSIELITNNPRKIQLLEELGVEVEGRIPCLVQPGEYSKDYLQAKGRRMDHMLDGDFCHWNHDGELEPAHPPKPIDEQTF